MYTSMFHDKFGNLYTAYSSDVDVNVLRIILDAAQENNTTHKYLFLDIASTTVSAVYMPQPCVFSVDYKIVSDKCRA